MGYKSDYHARYREEHREELAAYQREYNKKQTASGFWRDSYWKKRLKRQYGLSPEDYERMFDAQQGLCAICRKPEWVKYPSGATKRLCVDHDHETGEVRGLLCHSCNVGIGLLGDRSETVFAAAVYLAEHGA